MGMVWFGWAAPRHASAQAMEAFKSAEAACNTCGEADPRAAQAAAETGFWKPWLGAKPTTKGSSAGDGWGATASPTASATGATPPVVAAVAGIAVVLGYFVVGTAVNRVARGQTGKVGPAPACRSAAPKMHLVVGKSLWGGDRSPVRRTLRIRIAWAGACAGATPRANTAAPSDATQLALSTTKVANVGLPLRAIA